MEPKRFKSIIWNQDAVFASWALRGLVLPAIVAVGCLMSTGAMAVSPLEEWRAEAGRVRMLAENDLPRAYEAAKRLQVTLPTNATAADQARSLNLLSRVETYLALTEPAAAHAKEAFDIAVRNGDRIGQAESDLNVSLNSINQGKLDELATTTQHAVVVLEGTDRADLLGEAMLRTTVMYRRAEQLEDSIAVAMQAMEIARRSQNTLALTYAHHGLAIAFDLSMRAAESREHFEQMRRLARAANYRLLEGFAIAGLAASSGNSGDGRTAEQLYREAIAVYREVGAPFAVGLGLSGLASELIRNGRPQAALPFLSEASAIYERYPNRILRWFCLNTRSTAYQAIGDVGRAYADAEQAYAVAKDLGYSIYISGAATRLASVLAAKGDHKQAYAFSTEANELTSKSARERVSARLIQLIKRYESESKQREINELTRRNEQQTSQLRQRELQQRWLWTLLVAVAAGLAGGTFFVRRLRVLNASLEQRVQARTSELRQQARYLRTLIDMLPMWAWFKDTFNRYVVVNQGHADARGYTVDEMIGKSDLQLLQPEAAQRQLADDEEVMQSRVRKASEEWVLNGNTGVWMETYKAPVLDEDGTVLGTVGVARNISERKAVEAARESALAEATKLARQRSEFLAQMSHELRTPLNGILGFAQILQHDKTLSTRQARGLKVIEESGQHLLALINDILDLARIDAAKLELFTTDVNLPGLLQVVCDIVRVKAEEKNLSFVHEAELNLPMAIRVDEKRLRQVLLNLLSNAIKFTDAGQVILRAGCLLGAPGGHARLRFEVEDHGVGMTEEQMSRLFRPFEQVGEATRREGGSGLGLAISQQLVQLMGGNLHVGSKLGEGSVFWFEIDVPVLSGQAHGLLQRKLPIGYHGERRRLLVVDDVLQNRAMLLEILTGLGFTVADASNGEEALAVAARFCPDLVLMDLSMPVMDGFETTRRLRAEPRTRDLPVIATSASATDESQSRSRQAGANYFLPKPIDHARLLHAIGALLKLHWVHEDSASMPDVVAKPDDDDLVPPPQDEISVLCGLARVGNMRAIVERADHVIALDPRYAAFGTRLRKLAEGCQSKAIALLVERYSEQREEF